MPIKSFRGLIADGGIDTIALHTNNGAVGYRIKKLDIMVTEPGEQSSEHTIKIFTVPQTTVNNTIDFSDQTLIGVAWLGFGASTGPTNVLIDIFDNVTFNQDIYITASDTGGGAKGTNYHIELEMVKLDLNENTVATLKDIRNISSQ